MTNSIHTFKIRTVHPRGIFENSLSAGSKMLKTEREIGIGMYKNRIVLLSVNLIPGMQLSRHHIRVLSETQSSIPGYLPMILIAFNFVISSYQ